MASIFPFRSAIAMRWFLLLALTCLLAPGCSGFPIDARPGRAAPVKPAEDEHISLERELSLYSD